MIQKLHQNLDSDKNVILATKNLLWFWRAKNQLVGGAKFEQRIFKYHADDIWKHHGSIENERLVVDSFFVVGRFLFSNGTLARKILFCRVKLQVPHNCMSPTYFWPQ